MKITKPVTIDTDVEVTICADDIEEAIHAELSDPDAAITRTMNTIAQVVRGVIPEQKWADLTDKQREITRKWAKGILERLDQLESDDG